MTSEELDKLSERLKQFARVELCGYSPFYEKLTLRMSEDREMLELASRMRGGQPPQLFHAAVHFLLLSGEPHELRDYYPNLADTVHDGDPYPVFRSFCIAHAKAIREIIPTRRVQTNVAEYLGIQPRYCASVAVGGGSPAELWRTIRGPHGSAELISASLRLHSLAPKWLNELEPKLEALRESVHT
jgi:hypothetical protein